MIEIIRLIAGLLFIGVGVFIFIVATVGIFKFTYVLNRAHVAAKNDTLATLSIIVGLIILSGWNWLSFKLVIVAVFLWVTNPVATHLIVETEFITNKNIEEHVEVIDYDSI